MFVIIQVIHIHLVNCLFRIIIVTLHKSYVHIQSPCFLWTAATLLIYKFLFLINVFNSTTPPYSLCHFIYFSTVFCTLGIPVEPDWHEGDMGEGWVPLKQQKNKNIITHTQWTGDKHKQCSHKQKLLKKLYHI